MGLLEGGAGWVLVDAIFAVVDQCRHNQSFRYFKHVLHPGGGEVTVQKESQTAPNLRPDRRHDHLDVPFLAGVKRHCGLPLTIRLLNQQTPRNLILEEGTG